MYTQRSVESLKGRDYSEDLLVAGIILKCVDIK
jgi:hypothetical protein